MDSRKCQTSNVTPAQPGDFPILVNPASKNKRNFWVDGELGQGADHWLETATSVPGSWWSNSDQWLKAQGGKELPAPEQTGNKEYPEIEPATGPM